MKNSDIFASHPGTNFHLLGKEGTPCCNAWLQRWWNSSFVWETRGHRRGGKREASEKISQRKWNSPRVLRDGQVFCTTGKGPRVSFSSGQPDLLPPHWLQSLCWPASKTASSHLPPSGPWYSSFTAAQCWFPRSTAHVQSIGAQFPQSVWKLTASSGLEDSLWGILLLCSEDVQTVPWRGPCGEPAAFTGDPLTSSKQISQLSPRHQGGDTSLCGSEFLILRNNATIKHIAALCHKFWGGLLPLVVISYYQNHHFITQFPSCSFSENSERQAVLDGAEGRKPLGSLSGHGVS